MLWLNDAYIHYYVDLFITGTPVYYSPVNAILSCFD